MTFWLQFISHPPETSLLMEGSFNFGWVAVSVFLAFAASYAALSASSRINQKQELLQRLIWIAISALTLGIGIWAMHFVGMLAFSIPCRINYDPMITLLSMLPGILVSAIALGITWKRSVTTASPLVGSILLGAGIGTMHYAGMAALQLEGFVRYNPMLFALSILVAIVLAYIALRVKQQYPHPTRSESILVATILAGAVSAMHYIAMTAAYFIRGDATALPLTLFSPNNLAILVAVTTALLSLGTLTLASFSRMRKIADQLRDSEERWKFALEGASDGVWDWNIQTGEAIFSKRWKEMLGFSESEIGNHSLEWTNRVHPDDISGLTAAIKAHIEGNTASATIEYRMVCKDQSYKWILGRGMVVSRDSKGQPLRLVGTNSDITQQKGMTATLQESEGRFRSFANAAPTLIWVAGTDKLCNWFNQTWLEYTGRSMGQELGNGWAEGVHTDDIDSCLEIYSSHFDARKPFLMEYRLRNFRGEYHWFLDAGRPRFDEQGQFVGYIGMLTDITERKEAEVQVKKSQEQLESMTAAVPGVVYQFLQTTNGEWKFLFLSKGVEDLYEVTAEKAYQDHNVLTNCILPEDRESHLRSVKHSSENLCFWEHEHRILTPNGNLKWVQGRATPQKLTDGSTLWNGILTDVTERNALRQKLVQQANTDVLTGLSNRRHFYELAEMELARAQRYSTPLSVLMMDIDFFKMVNDTYGHKAGDLVLQKLAIVCKAVLREIDVIGRTGGEEFAVLLPNTAGPEALEVAERMRHELETSEVKLDNQNITLKFTVSIGVSSESNPEMTVDGLLLDADSALYKAKHAGRNIIVASF